MISLAWTSLLKRLCLSTIFLLCETGILKTTLFLSSPSTSWIIISSENCSASSRKDCLADLASSSREEIKIWLASLRLSNDINDLKIASPIGEDVFSSKLIIFIQFYV